MRSWFCRGHLFFATPLRQNCVFKKENQNHLPALRQNQFLTCSQNQKRCNFFSGPLLTNDQQLSHPQQKRSREPKPVNPLRSRRLRHLRFRRPWGLVGMWDVCLLGASCHPGDRLIYWCMDWYMMHFTRSFAIGVIHLSGKKINNKKISTQKNTRAATSWPPWAVYREFGI